MFLTCVDLRVHVVVFEGSFNTVAALRASSFLGKYYGTLCATMFACLYAGSTLVVESKRCAVIGGMARISSSDLLRRDLLVFKRVG